MTGCPEKCPNYLWSGKKSCCFFTENPHNVNRKCCCITVIVGSCRRTPWPGYATVHTGSQRPVHGSPGLWCCWRPPGFPASFATSPWQHLRAIRLASHPSWHCNLRWETRWLLGAIKVCQLLLLREHVSACLRCTCECYPGHLESAAQRCGASVPAVGVCVSGSVRCARLSVWRGRGSESGSPPGNAWGTRFQNLDKDGHDREKESDRGAFILWSLGKTNIRMCSHKPGNNFKTFPPNGISLRCYLWCTFNFQGGWLQPPNTPGHLW